VGRHALAVVVIWVVLGIGAGAQERRVFAGALVGVSALSADARSAGTPPDTDLSLYDPGSGPALNVFGGLHLSDYVSLQGNYIWNRNDLVLVSTSVTAAGGTGYEQRRDSDQHAAVADVLVYFRGRASLVRPYLGTGLAAVHFSSRETALVSAGLAAPDLELSATRLGLRSHVGIDVALADRLRVRYSFSETIGPNPIGPHLRPPGRRPLMNFQNLFGLVGEF
jgi:hypothetical protein